MAESLFVGLVLIAWVIGAGLAQSREALQASIAALALWGLFFFSFVFFVFLRGAATGVLSGELW